MWVERAQRAAALRLNPAALARQRLLNQLHSAMILLFLVGLAGWTGLLVSGAEGLVYGACLALAFLVLDPMPGDLLFRHAFGAVRLSPHQAPDLFTISAALARRAGLPHPPLLYLIPSPILQAMAAGSRGAPVIAVTSGLLRTLSRRELAAVLAHETAHIRHGDLLVLRLATTAASLTRGMAAIGALVLLAFLPMVWAADATPAPLAMVLLLAAPLLSDLLALSLSRRRELLADAGAVELTGDVAALAAALARIWRLQGDDWERLASRGPRWLSWLRTHPTIEDRIAALRGMAMPVPAGLSDPDRAAIAPRELWTLGSHHPAQRLARRWLL